MPKTSKITTFSLFSAILAFLAFCFYFHQKNNLTIENSREFKETGVISFEPETKNVLTEETEKKEDLSNPQEPKKEKKTTETGKEENETSPIKINQKLVNWGYSSSKNRSIDTIIIHSSYNALGGDYYSLSKLLEEYKEYGVSPHYLIDREGEIYQLVKDQNIAYHAGESKMPDGRSGVNDFSLGIELMNTESSNFTENQYQSLKKLISFIREKHKITSILGHNQISPGRKTDPWNFQWSKIK